MPQTIDLSGGEGGSGKRRFQGVHADLPNAAGQLSERPDDLDLQKNRKSRGQQQLTEKDYQEQGPAAGDFFLQSVEAKYDLRHSQGLIYHPDRRFRHHQSGLISNLLGAGDPS